MKRTTKLLHASAVALLFAAVAAGCGGDAAATENAATAPDTVRVETAEVRYETRALPIRTSGRLARKAEVDLAFKIGGVIDRIAVEEGEAVRAGQTLARLRQTEIGAQVSAAESGLAKAERDLARLERLHRDSVATLEDVQNARTAVDQAQSSAETARFNQRYATITAPMGGRILGRMAEEAELVDPGQAIFTLGADARGWVVRVGLADRDVVRLAPSDSASIRFDAFPGRAFPAYVTQIADAADPMNGTFEVELAVPDPERRLKSGFVGTAAVFPAEVAGYAVVPVEALVAGDGEDGVVYALEETEDGALYARRVSIRIGQLMAAEIAVADGLSGVTRVVTTGGAYLADGQPVRIAD